MKNKALLSMLSALLISSQVLVSVSYASTPTIINDTTTTSSNTDESNEKKDDCKDKCNESCPHKNHHKHKNQHNRKKNPDCENKQDSSKEIKEN